jgi:hypothetical protein
MSKHSGGFAISTYSQDIVESNAVEHFGPKHGDPSDRKKALSASLVSSTGATTRKGWAVLNKDVQKLELNSMEWLRKTFENAREEGHNDDELVGTFWFDASNKHQAEMVEMGVHERIDMSDASFGDLAKSVWSGVSWFGQAVLGGAISFFDIDADAMEEIERAS